ncbi:hypothetical protein BASA81_002767 [Batrachochytrium salamandrivorans]|nr:hypothetical protein BASA81_002767 [Batrachochytrium salamandrivorans]
MFTRKPTIEESVKQVKRDASRGQREIGRDVSQLDREEQKLVLQIKRAKTKSEQTILAKQVIQIRKEKEKLAGAQSKLGSLKTTATTMKANHTLGQVMGTTAKTMGTMNKAMNAQKMQGNLKDFERTMMQQGVNEEMMDDLLSSAFDGENEEDEVDDVVNQTLLELGVDLTKNMKSAPTHSVRAKPVKNAEEEEEDAEVDRLMREMLKG